MHPSLVFRAQALVFKMLNLHFVAATVKFFFFSLQNSAAFRMLISGFLNYNT